MEFNNFLGAFLLGSFIIFSWSAYFWRWGKKGELVLLRAGKNTRSGIYRALIYGIGLTGLLLMVFALSGPRLPMGLGNKEIEVNDIFFVVDVSRSMLAEDFEPNRLEAAKDKINEFIALMPTDRIGVVIFSEEVFTLLPLTMDLDLVKKVVKEIRIGPLGAGTNIGDAIGLATARAATSSAKNKFIILLTDGVSNMGNLTPIQSAEEASKLNLKVYTIAIGGDKDARIPIGVSPFGQKRYSTIPGGSVDFQTLKDIAEITGGSFFTAKTPEALNKVLNEISKMERTKIKKLGQVIYKELFYTYLVWGVILFLLSEGSRKFLIREVE